MSRRLQLDGGGMAEWLASPDWDREVVGSNPGVASDGICKYLSCLSLILC